MAAAHFVYIADVYCPWCYAFAPVMKQIMDEHPEFPVRVIGGNLISQPLTLTEDARANPGLVEFWRQVEQTSGRNLEGAIGAVEAGRDIRMYSPGADEILAVLKKMVPNQEFEQLIMLEDMFYGQGLDIFTDEALDLIARRWSLEPQAFGRALDQPAALAATERNLEEAGRLMGEITSYPSVLLVRDGKVDAVSRGYVHYETVAARLKDALQDLGLAALDEQYCSRHGACSLHGRR